MSSSHPAAMPERQDEVASQASSSNTSREQGTLSPPLYPGKSVRSSTRDSLRFSAHGSTNNSQSSRSDGTGRPSPYPLGDFRNGTPDSQRDVAAEIMVSHLANVQEEKIWVIGYDDDEGVVLKKTKGNYTCTPSQLAERPGGLFDAVCAMNVRVAMTVSTRVIKIIISANSLPNIETEQGLRIQVLPDYSHLPRCQKHQFAAFVNDPGVLVVWDDDPQKIVGRIQRLEKEVMAAVWGPQSSEDSSERKEPITQANELEVDDPESTRESRPRRLLLNQPCITALTLTLAFTAIGAGYRQVAVEIASDHKFIRIAFLAVFVPQLWLALFFFQALVGNVAQLFGPIGQMHQNTKSYSGIKPRRLSRDAGQLPHVTIQCPVYKEGLRSVIEPTVRSLKAAISTYEMQGGTANIFINDDGMQLISDENAQDRKDFYDEHSIGWVSRPKHNAKPADGEKAFLRRGKFKKASNMNYALWVSQRVEDKLIAAARPDGWKQVDEVAAYDHALAEVINEDGGRTWVEGNVRMGDYILLVDSDTRVPTDCLLDAVSEMEQSPEVAILQYSSGVMNVTTSFFENGITFFTNLIYTQIRFSVANGDVAPFVGHNAVLRWNALQHIAYDCTDDSREKYWSEETVSEDFDMALRLQTEGYLVRLAAYQGDGFKEGVSLTVYDELARWEKYAYGCNELIFNPLHKWLFHGPITPLFRRFLFSSMPLPSKLTICAYIGTYYALGSAWMLTLLNYFLTGWLNGGLDHYYIDSFKIYFSIIIVFSALGNLALAALRYRTGEKNIIAALVENLKWVPLMALFLGGISFHVSQALISHFLGIDMSWGATSKEAENITFFEEIPRVMKRFKWTFGFCFCLSALMVLMATVVPWMWRIDIFIAIFPLAIVVGSHFMLPIVLNPNLMLFTW